MRKWLFHVLGNFWKKIKFLSVLTRFHHFTKPAYVHETRHVARNRDAGKKLQSMGFANANLWFSQGPSLHFSRSIFGGKTSKVPKWQKTRKRAPKVDKVPARHRVRARRRQLSQPQGRRRREKVLVKSVNMGRSHVNAVSCTKPAYRRETRHQWHETARRLISVFFW